MSKETLLNRQFTEREVQRMRNIVMKKHGDKTQSQIGYENNIQRKEGDTWEEQGKTWTIKNGIKRSIPRLSKFKKQFNMPLTCPECDGLLDHKSDYVKYMYNLLHKCPTCVAKMESNLKLEGTFEDYAKNLHTTNLNQMLDNIEMEFDDFLNLGFSKTLTEDGEVNEWTGNSLTPEHIKEVKDWIKSQKEKIQ
jgi:hypothetical protein